jgi:curli biogenesis system outer membrane secretion channel CsgG
MRKFASVCLLFITVVLLPAAALAANTYTVLYFESNTGDAELATLGKGIADMLTTDFAKSGLDVVERSMIENVMSELSCL